MYSRTRNILVTIEAQLQRAPTDAAMYRTLTRGDHDDYLRIPM
jgi:hypothetical protein